ncbi:uncharacterized protein LOC111793513 [Cucurbita pepo subsp. pepo]|uniref:uncharacterized protein LOC111793513 n=1 Tax=Cucurbita pepo subsp. pepo TaxID=3664 RepID=UPI000C9D5B10|nr:uncharacterized protein LOC111793513 [Cucurbita pepo subsp. pepo]
MATFTSSLSLPLQLRPSSSRSPRQFSSPPPSLSFPLIRSSSKFPCRFSALTISSSLDSSSDDFDHGKHSNPPFSSKKSVLSSLIQEIEPLDVSIIQKDVPPTTVDAMKRTISGMLGLLPSDQFQVLVEALWEPVSKLLVSSIMTGYTLRNAEYRLCLERNLDFDDGNNDKQTNDDCRVDLHEILLDSANSENILDENEASSKCEEFLDEPYENLNIQGIGETSPEVQQHILHLKLQLSSIKKELHEVKRKSAALQMQQFVGEEKNDLLDYLRSLQPEKVAELSEPTSPDLKEAIHSVVHGLLATLSPKIHSKVPSQSENIGTGTTDIGNEDCAELVENTSLQFQPLLTLTRDYLARLLFWCMLLGHYMRGLEYRMELMNLLSLSSNVENASGGVTSDDFSS